MELMVHRGTAAPEHTSADFPTAEGSSDTLRKARTDDQGVGS